MGQICNLLLLSGNCTLVITLGFRRSGDTKGISRVTTTKYHHKNIRIGFRVLNQEGGQVCLGNDGKLGIGTADIAFPVRIFCGIGS